MTPSFVPFSLSPSLIRAVKVPTWVYELLVVLIALVWVSTVAACFACSFLGKPVPEFAVGQLKWMTFVLGAVLVIPRPKQNGEPTDDSSSEDPTAGEPTSDSQDTVAAPSANAGDPDVSTFADAPTK